MSEESKTPRTDALEKAYEGFSSKPLRDALSNCFRIETELSAANARIAELEKDRVASPPAPAAQCKRCGRETRTPDRCKVCEQEDNAAQPAERPTPITDEMLWQYDHLGPNWLATEILGPFARNLERQLAEAREQRDTAMRRANKIAAEALALTEQRGALAEALVFYADVSKYPSPLTGGMGDLYFDCGQRAKAALAAINPDTPS